MNFVEKELFELEAYSKAQAKDNALNSHMVFHDQPFIFHYEQFHNPFLEVLNTEDRTWEDNKDNNNLVELLYILQSILYSVKKLFILNYNFYLQVQSCLGKVEVEAEAAYIVNALVLDRVDYKVE